MSNQERTRQRDHWQAIAEQLGLAPEGEQPPAESEEAVEPAKIQRSATPPEEATEADLSEAETSFSPSEPETIPEDLEQDTLHEEESPPATASRESHRHAVSEEAPDEKPERPSRRRGRRDRSEQSRRPVGGEQNEGQTASLTEDAVPEGSGEEPGRGRGRRKKGRPSRESTDQPAETDIAPEAASQESEADDEIEDLGDFSNWSVPSWNELIASLYRPER